MAICGITANKMVKMTQFANTHLVKLGHPELGFSIINSGVIAKAVSKVPKQS